MWQPIETAPKDQTFLAVLNCAGEQTICTMRWPVAEAKNSRPDHHAFHVERVTHWMPLPALPGAHPAPIEDSITAGILSGMFLSLDGHDKAQPGYEWRKGWNDAIRQAMDYAQPAPSIPDTHNDMVVGLDYQGAMSCARQRAKKEAGLLYPEGDARKEEKERELASEYYRQYTTPNPEAKP